jgi:hypothetical protein
MCAASLRLGITLVAAVAAWSGFGGMLRAEAQAVERNRAALYGEGWNCNRGYQGVGSGCEAVVVPPNAYLSASGDDWECERLFRERDGACEALLIPANAYAEDRAYARGWRCERGFRSEGSSCMAFEVPSNAHIDYSGNAWECNAHHRRAEASCVAER